jgi:ABC-type ATPase with predicted acetyltransferase domain
MSTYSISKSFNWQGTVTDNVTFVCRMFGLTIDRLTEKSFDHKCQIEINDGDIVYITGASGTGKSVLLRELEKTIPPSDRINLAQIELPNDKAVIDCIEEDSITALNLLCTAGLGDCFCMLNQPGNLSEGEQYRFRLVMALASKKKFVFADEFCCGLDRITALVISNHIYKFAKRTGTTFILASSHNDILLELQPDVIVTKRSSGPAKVDYKIRR